MLLSDFLNIASFILGVVSAIFSIISLIISVISFIFQNNRKTLEYSILLDVPTHVFKIQFRNRGHQVIDPSDFAPSEPLQIISCGNPFHFDKPPIIRTKDKASCFSVAVQSPTVLDINFHYIAPGQIFELSLKHFGSIAISGTLKIGKIVPRAPHSTHTKASFSQLLNGTAILFAVLFLVFALIFYFSGPLAS